MPILLSRKLIRQTSLHVRYTPPRCPRWERITLDADARTPCGTSCQTQKQHDHANPFLRPFVTGHLLADGARRSHRIIREMV